MTTPDERVEQIRRDWPKKIREHKWCHEAAITLLNRVGDLEANLDAAKEREADLERLLEAEIDRQRWA